MFGVNAEAGDALIKKCKRVGDGKEKFASHQALTAISGYNAESQCTENGQEPWKCPSWSNDAGSDGHRVGRRRGKPEPDLIRKPKDQASR